MAGPHEVMGTLAAALLAAAAPAPERDAPAPVSAWTIAPGEDGTGCFATRRYEERTGHTTLLFGLDADGANHLSVLNDHWSIEPKARLTLDFRLTRGAYPRHFAIGIAADGQRGFVTQFERDFPTYLAASRRLDIARGRTPVEKLPLDGSLAAIADLKRCVGSLKTPRRARTADDGIPRDPFAPRSGGRRDP